MTLYYIRHLATSWNQQGLLQGSRDIPILPPDELTLQDIEVNRKRLSDIDFSVVLTSNLQRTHQTAEAYGFDQYKIEPLLNEFNFGRFEGQPKQMMLDEAGLAWSQDVYQLGFGEPINDLKERIIAFIDKYSPMDCGLAFGHGFFGRALMAHLLDHDLQQMNQRKLHNNDIIELTF